MINDNAPTNTAWGCWDECNKNPSCQFWDLAPANGGRICRLRSDKGPKGEMVDDGFLSGPRNCNLGMFTPTIVQPYALVL